MKKSLLAGLICMTGAATPVWACTQPPSQIITLPAGVDGKLPITPPNLQTTPTLVPGAPTPTPTPTRSPSSCPQVYRYAYNADVPSLTDQEIIDRLGGNLNTPQLSAGWVDSNVYLAGAKASFNGKNYTAKWWTQGTQPDTPNGPWKEDADINGVLTWSATRTYNTGEQVVYNGKLYSAKWWTQNEQPGASEWGGWELRGDPPAGTIDASAMPGSFNVAVSKTGDQLLLNFNASRTVQWKHTHDGQCGLITTRTGNEPFAERWEVRLDGVTVATSDLSLPMVSGTLPPPKVIRLPDGSCPAAGGVAQTNGEGQLQTATATVAAGSSRFLSVWACKGTQCRPSKLLDHLLMGGLTLSPNRYVSP
ncbi:hypothetical protein IGB42_00302 [Andreprevotia sp. IGB-42]|uniref:carbohydrate-binding protein n=1 Tax=Andreprevotia sp. IGB-42 TaxID=2497473 RepID=UPI001357B5A4|nr:carbohydrate-binding protein [Andreprevotia sp. IGB-42]KAF0815224.1 hypothetical protein IGB42_00302 [Andreprevotia sp. IGB-42]